MNNSLYKYAYYKMLAIIQSLNSPNFSTDFFNNNSFINYLKELFMRIIQNELFIFNCMNYE